MNPSSLNKRNKEEILRLNNKLADLNVLIDTLRSTLMRAENVLNEKDVKYVFTRASRWAMSEDLN